MATTWFPHQLATVALLHDALAEAGDVIESYHKSTGIDLGDASRMPFYSDTQAKISAALTETKTMPLTPPESAIPVPPAAKHSLPFLTDLAGEVHRQNVQAGWWDGWADDKYARHETAMMLVVSELAEAMEGDRKNLMDDHLPDVRMFDVELADAMIRLLDLAGAYKLALRTEPEYLLGEAKRYRTLSRPEGLMSVIRRALNDRYTLGIGGEVHCAIVHVAALADANGVDLWGLVERKRAYNATRLDHKREERAKTNGKAY